MIKKLSAAALAAVWLVTPAFAAEKLTIETSKNCAFEIKLRADLAPIHVAQIAKLAGAGFYNGILFHR
ncbi:MAG: peptidylprolyl isomerase, partial [Methylocella sp.]